MAQTIATHDDALVGLSGLHLPPRKGTLSAREFISRLHSKNASHRLSRIISLVSQASGVGEATLRLHVMLGREVRKPTAVKLATWSGGWINAAKTMGVE